MEPRFMFVICLNDFPQAVVATDDPEIAENKKKELRASYDEQHPIRQHEPARHWHCQYIPILGAS